MSTWTWRVAVIRTKNKVYIFDRSIAHGDWFPKNGPIATCDKPLEGSVQGEHEYEYGFYWSVIADWFRPRVWLPVNGSPDQQKLMGMRTSRLVKFHRGEQTSCMWTNDFCGIFENEGPGLQLGVETFCRQFLPWKKCTCQVTSLTSHLDGISKGEAPGLGPKTAVPNLKEKHMSSDVTRQPSLSKVIRSPPVAIGLTENDWRRVWIIGQSLPMVIGLPKNDQIEWKVPAITPIWNKIAIVY